MAIMLLSLGWKARKVEAGGGGMNVVITYKSNQFITNQKTTDKDPVCQQFSLWFSKIKLINTTSEFFDLL